MLLRRKTLPKGRYEFEVSILTLPKGFAKAGNNGVVGPALSEPFIMPILIDVIPEGGWPNFPYLSWHYCQHPKGAGSFGSIACARPILDVSGDQMVLFYDDSEAELVPRIKTDPKDPDECGIPRDPNSRYYPLPLLLPNQNICYYLVPEYKQKTDHVIDRWQSDLKKWQATIKKWQAEKGPEEAIPHFFVAIDSPFVFEDSLQIFFSDEVNMPKPVEAN